MKLSCKTSPLPYKSLILTTPINLTRLPLKPTINTLRGVFSFIIVASAFLISCNKEPDLIGLDLLPPGDKLNVGLMDTTTIVAYTLYEDTVRTDELAATKTQGIIGSVYDPVFGKTSATLYTQLQMTTVAPVFGSSPVCDSLVLVLPYVTLFGDTAALQTFKVYELSEALHLDSVYYSNMHVTYNLSSLLAQQTFLPRVKDSIVIDTATKIIPQLRLQFDKALGNRFLTASATDLATNEAFISFFKGIAITTDEENTPGKGSLVSFNLQNTSYSKLRMYYHNNTDTTVFDFTIGSSCARFNQYNHFGHANATPDFKAQLSGDTTLGQQKLYIQALGGTKIKLRFPYLKKWASDKKIAINDAQLIMTNADVSAPYTPPAQLAIRVLNKDASLSFTVDEIEGAAYLDGTYNSAKAYRFRISRYIQQLLISKADNYGLYLYTYNPSVTANRLVLNGTSKQLSGHIKLAITYTLVSE